MNIEEYAIVENDNKDILITFNAVNDIDFIQNCDECFFEFSKGVLKIEYIKDKKLIKEISLINLVKKSVFSIKKRSTILVMEVATQPFHYPVNKK
jgi:hypothetical protein